MREYGGDRPWDGWVTIDPVDDGSGRVRVVVWNRGLGHTDASISRAAFLDREEALALAVDLAAYTEGYGDDDDREPGDGVRLPEGRAEEGQEGEG